MKITLASLFAFLFICLLACNKDDDEPNKATVLTSTSWKLDQTLVAGTPISDPNLLAQLGQFSNSTVLFKADGTYTATDRTTNATTTGTWRFNEDQTRLLVDTTDRDFDFKIEVLTDKNLNLSTPFEGTAPGTQVIIRATVELRLIPA